MVKNKITQRQYNYFIISAALIIAIVSMPSNLSKSAQQNGYISVIVGNIYPLFILLASNYIDKKTNHKSIFEISNQLYGKIFSSIFFTIYLALFFTVFSSILAGFSNILTISICAHLKPSFIMVPTLILITLVSLLGLTMAGRICEFYFYISFPVLIVTIFLLPKGSITNILPINITIKDLVRSVPETFFSFSCFEISFFIIDKITGKRDTFKSAFFVSLFIGFIYLLNTFIIIYVLGFELTSILEYPLLYIIQAIEIPIISNFLSLVFLLWSLIALKGLLTYSYITSEILSKITKISYKKACIIISIFVLIYAFFMIPNFNRKLIIDKLLPFFVTFSLCWTILTTILVSIKYKKN